MTTALTIRRQAGFTLLEALIALLVAAFGMLAIAGLHTALSQGSDVAKQRAEAVRLAQKKIEELRAFQQVAAHTGTPHIFNFSDDVVTGFDTVSPTSGSYTTNTEYRRDWIVTGNATDPQKWVRMFVRWADRTGANLDALPALAADPVGPRTVLLQTVIAQSDPKSIGTLAVGPGGIRARTPKNRNVDIPYPAISLAGGKSAFQPGSDTVPNPNPFFVFDNVTGEVLGSCSYTLALTTGSTVTFQNDDGTGTTTAGCTKRRSYLLSGYIGFHSGGYNQNSVDTTFGTPTGATRSLSADLVSTNAAHKECYAQRQKVVRATGSITPVNIQSASRSGNVVTITTQGNHGMNVDQYVAISDVGDATFNGVFKIKAKLSNTQFTYDNAGGDLTAPSGTYTPKATLVQQLAVADVAVAGTDYASLYSDVVSRYVGYTCIVEPVDHDTNPATPKRWSGQFVITPLPASPDPGAWSLGDTNGTYKVCRYTGDYYPDSTLSNSEHPLHYRGVRGALDNQNYVVVDGNVACPADGPVNTFAQPPDYVNANTTQHQTQPGNSCSAPCGGQRSGTNSGGGPANNGGLPTDAEASSYASSFSFPMIRANQ